MIFLIHSCLSTSKIAIRYNKNRTSYFQPSRELRQDDPLSPLLFIICTQVLSKMIQTSFHTGTWKPITLKNIAINITRLIFADDIIIFCKSTPESLNETQAILHDFCNAFGQ